MHRNSQPGFTLLELLVVVAVMGILAALLVSAIEAAKAHTRTIACVSQLKQVGIASIAFADEQQRRLYVPRLVATNNNHRILVEPFEAVMHELGTAKIFLCPADSERFVAPNLTSLQQTNTSYFVSWSAMSDQPRAILAGDRNITRTEPVVGIPGGVPARMTGNNRLFRTNSFGWWRDIHRLKGNVLLADGSVHTTGANELNAEIAAQPEPDFSWFIPNGKKITTP